MADKVSRETKKGTRYLMKNLNTNEEIIVQHKEDERESDKMIAVAFNKLSNSVENLDKTNIRLEKTITKHDETMINHTKEIVEMSTKTKRNEKDIKEHIDEHKSNKKFYIMALIGFLGLAKYWDKLTGWLHGVVS